MKIQQKSPIFGVIATVLGLGFTSCDKLEKKPANGTESRAEPTQEKPEESPSPAKPAPAPAPAPAPPAPATAPAER